ncbi:MAG: hypothetical protein AAF847_02725 [Bacteroidota bacterium]
MFLDFGQNVFISKSLFGVGLNCKSVVYGSGEENNSDFIEMNE